MEEFQPYLQDIINPQHKQRMETLFTWIQKNYPNLTPKFAWKQPMYTAHGTFIIGFSMNKNHMSISPEKVGIDYFSSAIKASGYTHGKMQFQIPWDTEVDYALIAKMIDYNLEEKADLTTFWRK